MTIHAPGSPTHAWRCESTGCRGCGAGFPSATAAHKAETHHAELAHHTRQATR
jgi:hypothetical protein